MAPPLSIGMVIATAEATRAEQGGEAMTMYLARSAHAHILAAENRLAAHRLDPDTGRCARCSTWSPCATANGAFEQLNRYGVTVSGLDADPCPGRAPRSPLMTLMDWARTTSRGPHRLTAGVHHLQS